MLARLYHFLDADHLDPRLPQKLRRLADDIEAVRLGLGPTPEQLEHAPLITGWRAAVTSQGMRLRGVVSSASSAETSLTLTSQVWAAHDGAGWMRTLGRFYRVGRPATFDDFADDDHD